VEFVRGNELLWLGMSGPQVFLLVMLPLLVWRTWRVFAKPPGGVTPPSDPQPQRSAA
jgi:hypothetical protein